MSVEVIKPGTLVRNNLGAILSASSTVTLICGDGHDIIVDTGLPNESQDIKFALKRYGLSENDIDIVINTHLHGDHVGNNAMFSEAEFIVHEKELPVLVNSVRKISGEYRIGRNIEIIETPGHTLGSISVVVKRQDDNKTYVIAGDALPIRDNFLYWIPPGINFNPIIALESMKRIVDIADFVVPGHDNIFPTKFG